MNERPSMNCVTCVTGLGLTTAASIPVLRYITSQTLPATLRDRDSKEGGAYVTKAELYQIMKWCVHTHSA